MSDDIDTTFNADHRGRCRSCGAAVWWAVTGAAKRMPVDLDPHPDGNVALAEGAYGRVLRATVLGPLDLLNAPDDVRYRSHFVTCPQSDEWRRS